MTTTPLVTSTASHHVSHAGVHTAGVLGFGSNFFHFQFSAADINCAFFQELFGYVFTLVGDKTKVFAFILDLQMRKKSCVNSKFYWLFQAYTIIKVSALLSLNLLSSIKSRVKKVSSSLVSSKKQEKFTAKNLIYIDASLKQMH
jgi:hypothetical protein